MEPAKLTGRSLDREHIDFFKRRGFLPLANIIPTSDVAKIRGIAEQLFFGNAGFAEGAFFDFVGDEPKKPRSLSQMLLPSNYAPGLKQTEFRKAAQRIAKQVLGPRARFAGDHIFYKPPGTGPETPWHQDEAFRDPAYEYEEVSFWLPLQAVNEASGCMRFIPLSHEGPILPHRTPGNGKAHGLECYDGFDTQASVACPLPLGGCTMHTGRTVHGASPNTSGIERYAYVVVFDLPRRLAREVRDFPWLKKDTSRQAREVEWLKKGGRYVRLYRRIKQFNFADPTRLAYALIRTFGRLDRRRFGRR
jgi:hypothetical protein